MMMWKKPEGLKYVDLCIYIDEHAHELVEPGDHTQEENLIYNYIWLLVKALAIKKRMFNSFNDYDGYALHSANRLFFALRKSYLNEGKTIKGKTIKPIKSILNYTKALLYPMKLEYLNEQYKSSINSVIASKKFDEFTYRQRFNESVWYQQGGAEEFKRSVEDLFNNFKDVLDETLQKSPFKAGTIDYKKIKISIMLNCLKSLKAKKGLNDDPVTISLWKLPKSMSSYVRVFIKELGTELKNSIMRSYKDSQIDDRVISYLISNPDGEYIDNEKQY